MKMSVLPPVLVSGDGPPKSATPWKVPTTMPLPLPSTATELPASLAGPPIGLAQWKLPWDGLAPTTVTSAVSVLVAPRLSVTVSVMLYVPGELYEWLTTPALGEVM